MTNMRQKLQNGEKLTGTMVVLNNTPDIMKIMKGLGFDFVIIDCEHGYYDYDRVAGMLGMARAIDIPALVRLPQVRRELCLKYLEMGGRGFLLPNTENAEMARELVEYSKYAPLGSRGVALGRANTDYIRPASAVDAMSAINESVFLMAQIESPNGVNNIDDILSTPGIDAAFIGPNDLSQSYGIMGQFTNPILVEAMEKIIASAQKHGKASGIHLMAAAPLKEWMAKGMNLNLCSNDLNMLMDSGRALLEQLRA